MSRKYLDEAYALLYRIQFLQSLALAAQHELDKQYHIVDYADTLKSLVDDLQTALDGLERDLAA
ncbi:MAG: hypothetical protein Q4P13_09115 [Psychrobacter sp.]|nr:hypothetical protein [Psychrobacter sp.]